MFAAADGAVPGRLAILPALPPLRPQIEVAAFCDCDPIFQQLNHHSVILQRKI
jgi:hypothetical protein